MSNWHGRGFSSAGPGGEKPRFKPVLLAIPLGVLLLFNIATGNVDLINADNSKVDRLLEQKAQIEATVAAQRSAEANPEVTSEAANAAASPSPTARVATCQPSGDPGYCLYTIENGDNLAKIASQFGLDGYEVPGWELIFESNKEDLAGIDDVIVPGWTLRIPTSNSVVYLVLPGDSISSIAAGYGVTMESIVKANGISDPDDVQMGDLLIVPEPKEVPEVTYEKPEPEAEADAVVEETVEEVVEEDEAEESVPDEEVTEEDVTEAEEASEDEEDASSEQEDTSEDGDTEEQDPSQDDESDSNELEDDGEESSEPDEGDSESQDDASREEEEQDQPSRSDDEEDEDQRPEPESAPQAAPEPEETKAEEPAPPPPAPQPDDPTRMSWPVVQPLYITNYMTARHPLGMDFGLGANPRSSIMAAASGTVEFAGGDPCCSYGYYVIVDHGNGLKTLYAHFSSIGVSKGQWVERGQALGIAGDTGNSRGVHLHFEVYKNGTRVDPMIYLPGN